MCRRVFEILSVVALLLSIIYDVHDDVHDDDDARRKNTPKKHAGFFASRWLRAALEKADAARLRAKKRRAIRVRGARPELGAPHRPHLSSSQHARPCSHSQPPTSGTAATLPGA